MVEDDRIPGDLSIEELLDSGRTAIDVVNREDVVAVFVDDIPCPHIISAIPGPKGTVTMWLVDVRGYIQTDPNGKNLYLSVPGHVRVQMEDGTILGNG